MAQNLQQVGDVVLKDKEDFEPWYQQKLKGACIVQIEELVSPDKNTRIEDIKLKYPTPSDTYNRDLPEGKTLKSIQLKELNADEKTTYKMLEDSYYQGALNGIEYGQHTQHSQKSWRLQLHRSTR